jgi:hypothetical protein
MVVRGSAWRAAICTSRRSTPASSMVVTPVAQHVGMHARESDSGTGGEAEQPSGGGVAVHSGASGVEQDRPDQSAVHGPVDGSPYGWRQRHEDDSGALADYPQHPVSVFLAKVGHVGAGSFEDPQSEQAEHRDQGEVDRLADSRAAVSIASNCRCVSPRVGDSAGTVGRRTYAAGECCRTPSMTAVR